jgi:hypothetical protein
MYVIKPRTHKIAREEGVYIFPSENPKYKIDIYDHHGLFMFRVGSASYKDFPTYIEERGKTYADKRRRLYMARHAKEIEKSKSRGWWAYRLLWS